MALSWAANPEPDIKGYNVYRSTTATVPTTAALNATPIAGTSFTDDTAVNGTAYYYVVVAVDNADQASPASNASAPVTPQPTEPALAPLPLKINFSIAGAAGPTVSGYTKDTGLPFTNAVGRGWVEPGTHNPRNLSDNARYRDPFGGATAVTPQQRGLVHMESADITATFNGTKTSGSYEVAVADGYYDVTASVGDQPGSATASCLAPCYDSQHSIKVEGTTAIDQFQATATKEFAEKTVKHVHVTDGRLTIDSGAADSFNTKINYLEIAQSDVTAPGIPANVEATAGDGSVALTWDDVDADDLKGYLVYRSTDESVALTEANLLTPTAITGTSFTDSSAVNKTAYHYVVISVDDEGNKSDASETVNATPEDTTAPAVPQGLLAIAGDGSVHLAWTPVTDLDLANYRIYRSTSSPVAVTSENFVGASTDAQYTSGTVTDPLTNGTKYFFAVSSVDTEGNESALSDEKSATPTETADVTAPLPPTNVSAVAGDNKVTLHWTGGEESDLASYQVLRAAATGGPYTPLGAGTVPSTTTSFVDATALNGSRYYYVLTARDFAGNTSGESAEVDATPVDNVAPAAPTGVVATAGIQRITVSWAANTETDVVRYRIYRFPAATPEINDAHLVAILTTATGRTFVDSDRTPGTTYHYAVVAVDAAGNASDASDVVGATALDTPDTTAPGAPAGLLATVTDGDVTLTWNPVTAGDLAGYTVYRSATAGGAKVKVSSTLLTGTSFVDTDAPAGATSYYLVTATDTAGNESGNSNQVSAEIPAAGIDVKFVFAPTTAAAVTGYTKETGAAFDATRGYGWVTQASLSSATHTPLDFSANTRLRTRAAVTDLQNRLVHLQYGDIVPTPTANGSLTAGAWEYLVPNGRYTVIGERRRPAGCRQGRLRRPLLRQPAHHPRRGRHGDRQVPGLSGSGVQDRFRHRGRHRRSADRRCHRWHQHEAELADHRQRRSDRAGHHRAGRADLVARASPVTPPRRCPGRRRQTPTSSATTSTARPRRPSRSAPRPRSTPAWWPVPASPTAPSPTAPPTATWSPPSTPAATSPPPRRRPPSRRPCHR